jgi:flavin reductase (DIM6/NTAB) family NADH-FMN oxidoreductase RutF
MLPGRKILKRILLGPIEFPQKLDLEMQDPQSEVDVWLDGLGERLDVTHIHLMACGAPFTICIQLEEKSLTDGRFDRSMALRFQERSGERRQLGEIRLRFVAAFRVGTRQLCLFSARGCRNLCLPKLHLWAHYLLYARRNRQAKDSDVPITAREARAMIVFYLCPRPTAVVTVQYGDTANMFPMNLMGSVGSGYFAFALNSNRAAAPLVERAGRIVLSNIPLENAALVFRLAANHRRTSIDLGELPFPTVRLHNIDALVPSFALRVRELQVEAVRRLGSHTLFVAKTIADERLADGPALCSAHGIYQAWHSPQRPSPAAWPLLSSSS